MKRLRMSALLVILSLINAIAYEYHSYIAPQGNEGLTPALASKVSNYLLILFPNSLSILFIGAIDSVRIVILFVVFIVPIAWFVGASMDKIVCKLGVLKPLAGYVISSIALYYLILAIAFRL